MKTEKTAMQQMIDLLYNEPIDKLNGHYLILKAKELLKVEEEQILNPNETEGLKAIAFQRNVKQIEKYGYTGQHHATHPEYYDKGQLAHAARLLSYEDDEELVRGKSLEGVFYPENWDKHRFLKLMQKPYLERLEIAGSFFAAEIDRINHLK